MGSPTFPSWVFHRFPTIGSPLNHDGFQARNPRAFPSFSTGSPNMFEDHILDQSYLPPTFFQASQHARAHARCQSLQVMHLPHSGKISHNLCCFNLLLLSSNVKIRILLQNHPYRSKPCGLHRLYNHERWKQALLSQQLCQHLCQLWFWDTQQSLPRLPLTAMPVLPFRGYEDSLEVDIVEVPARGHLRLIALKLFGEQLINQTLEIWFHEIIILFCFLFGRISNPWDR